MSILRSDCYPIMLLRWTNISGSELKGVVRISSDACWKAHGHCLSQSEAGGQTGVMTLLSCCMWTGGTFAFTFQCSHNVFSTTFGGLAHRITIPPLNVFQCIYTCGFMWSNAIRLQFDHNQKHFQWQVWRRPYSARTAYLYLWANELPPHAPPSLNPSLINS